MCTLSFRFFIGALVSGIFFLVTFAHAVDITTDATVASPVEVSGEVRDGDVVSYDVKTNTYKRSSVPNDEHMIGVVVDDPVLIMGGQGEGSSTRPIVRFGEVEVNASTLKGMIRAGDRLTSSSVPGLVERASGDEDGYLLGFALAPLVAQEGTALLSVGGEEVRVGRVRVALRIGPYISDLGEKGGTTTAAALAAAETKVDKGGVSFDPFKAFRYILGSVVAIGAVLIALRRFGDMFAQSVVSVGRNPLARTQIRSIMIWNGLIIVIISGVGVSLGAAIILLP